MTGDRHTFYLDTLIKNFRRIDEDPTRIHWVSKEGILLREGYRAKSQMALCDLLIGFHDGTGLCVELKASPAKRDHALEQLANGKNLMEETMKYWFVRQKIVYYTKGLYTFEEIWD